MRGDESTRTQRELQLRMPKQRSCLSHVSRLTHAFFEWLLLIFRICASTFPSVAGSIAPTSAMWPITCGEAGAHTARPAFSQIFLSCGSVCAHFRVHEVLLRWLGRILAFGLTNPGLLLFENQKNLVSTVSFLL